MWIKRVIVKVPTINFQDINSIDRCVGTEFIFYYTPFTRIKKLLSCAYRKCKLPGSYNEEKTHFMVWRKGELCWLNEHGCVAKLYKYLNCDGSINLNYVYCNGIGGVLNSVEGVQIKCYSNERGHIPHVHAEYQGKKISIEIDSLKVKGSFKNPKKEKIAVQCVKQNREKYLQAYCDQTNGILVVDI